MKDLVGFLLNVNVYVWISNTAKRRLFNCAAGVIEYYLSIWPLRYIEFLFFWFSRLGLLIGPPTDLNRTKSKSHSKNDNISNRVAISNDVDIADGVDNEIS